MPKYWLVTTSPENFKVDKETSGFTVQGLKERHKKTVMKFGPGDKVVYYINRISKLGAIATITSGYYHDDKTRIWTDEDEIWPSRAKSRPEIILEDDELLDIKKLIKQLSFIKNKDHWSLFVRGSIRPIPEEDYLLIESEMRKTLSRERITEKVERPLEGLKTESDYIKAVMKLPLNSESLHDRIAEMLQTVGSWMEFNTNTRFRITPESAYQLDVAWLSGKNPEVAIEVQIGGNIDSAIIKLREAREFNYRKVILVIEEEQISRLSAVLRFDPIRNWLDAWSIKSVYELYTNGQKFFELYDKLKEARYRERKELELI
jgi:predicted RNA-binding protein